METIGDLLSRDLSQRIEEVIQVHQADEQSVYSEVSEYVATNSIRDQYAVLLKAVAEAPAEPYESIGVWVSGFFGSGKSSFAKNFGYALKNPKVLGEDFARLFKRQLDDERAGNLLDLINAKIPTEVILFEVAKEKDTRRVTERIAELMYVVLLRELGYAEEWDIAELEIELEAEGRLQDFVELCQTLHKRDWTVVRSGAQRVARASAILHHLDPATYPSADSWSHSRREPSISVSKVVERTFELARRRRPGKALVFIIDEVGQHVARSGDKIEDLRATVEEFGKVGKNLLKARKIVAPCWIVVTSQEKLDEVVAAIDSKRVELAKLQDRFHYRVDLAPSDIREVATKRVLAKKEPAVPILTKLYNDHQGQLNAALRLERTTRKTEISEADFVHFYPYPPHYIDLCIGIMSGIRLQPGAPRHYGGSNRTIIKQAYEMLVSDRTAMATRAGRHTGHARQGVRTGRGQPLQREAFRHPRDRRAVQGRPRGPGLGAPGRQGRLPPGVPPGSAPHRGEHRRLPRRSGGNARPAAAGQGGGQEARRSAVPPGDRGRLEADDAPGEELGEGAGEPSRPEAPRAERDHPQRPPGDLRRTGAQDLPPQGTPQLPHRRGCRRGDARRRRLAADALHRRRTRRPVPQAQRGA